MPPKPKFTKEEIVQTALEVVSQKDAALRFSCMNSS